MSKLIDTQDPTLCLSAYFASIPTHTQKKLMPLHDYRNLVKSRLQDLGRKTTGCNTFSIPKKPHLNGMMGSASEGAMHQVLVQVNQSCVPRFHRFTSWLHNSNHLGWNSSSSKENIIIVIISPIMMCNEFWFPLGAQNWWFCSRRKKHW